MKLNQNPNLRVEDFSGQQEWIGRLFTQLNPFIAAVNQAFDSNVDFLTNIKSYTKQYTVTEFQAFKMPWPYKDSPPSEVSVIQAASGSQLTPTILMAAWTYDATSQTISIPSMIELTSKGVSAPSGRYQFTIRASV